MEILFCLVLAVTYVSGAFISSFQMSKALLEEKKFHLITNDGQTRILSGKRRRPLEISEAEAHISAIKKVSRMTRWSWPLTLWRLYGPKRSRIVETDLDKMRNKAIESQRTDLLNKAFHKGYEHDPIISILMRAQTDESFKILRSKIEDGVLGVPLKIDSAEAKVYSDSISPISGETVLLSITKKEVQTASVNTKQTGNSIEKEFQPTKYKLQSNSHGGVPLPEGYSWDLGWKARGGEFEQIVVSVISGTGKIVRSEGFYTSIHGTEREQKEKINKIQKKLANSAHHDLQDGKIDKSFLS